MSTRDRNTNVSGEYREEDDVGGTCGTNGGEEERVYVIGRKDRRRETTTKGET
jgi:hypothetical protein